MSFKDGQNSVKSLLALLQSTQDGGSATPPDNDAPAHHNPRHAQHGSSSSYDPHRPGQTSSYAASYPARPISSVNPTQRQLDDLLASLKNPPPATSSSSAFDGSRNSLIEPFGPIGKRARQEMGFDPLSLGPAVPASDAHAESSKPGHSGAAHASRRGEKEWDEMGYTRALPIISELLEDEGFTKELKSMKAEQDGLERRLWAKQERLKAEHEKSLSAEKDIARITRKPVPPDRQAQWANTLATSLDQFYLETVLPSLDGLALRQTQRLQELGVPGLGGHGEEQVKRVKRLMDVIQAGMDA